MASNQGISRSSSIYSDALDIHEPMDEATSPHTRTPHNRSYPTFASLPDAFPNEQDSEVSGGDVDDESLEQDVGGDDDDGDDNYEEMTRLDSSSSGYGGVGSDHTNNAMDVDDMQVDDDEEMDGSGSGSGSGSVSGSGLSTSKPSVPIVDEKAQSELRRKIMEIQRDPSIEFGAKAGLIQKLMSSKWHVQRVFDEQKDDSVAATEDDLKTTYYNAELGHLGCKHYRRGCKLKANCCGKWFNCRFCHDDVCDHNIVRNETKSMLCMKCKTIQPAAQDCNSCHVQLAAYYCDVCKLWDDDPTKPIYHCDDCGICRIGRGLGQDYFHCKKCNVCMNINFKGDHKCIERNLECDCPICGEYMFTSTSTVIFMPCGHCIHSKCHEDYIKTSYQCPTCWKALGNMSGFYAKIDSLLAEQTMPPEYANIFSNVLCNDCEVKSEAPYHFLYHRCNKCKGYNTKVLETFKRVSNGQVQQVEVSAAVAEASNSRSDTNSGGESSGTRVGSSLSSVPRSPLMDQNASGDMTIAGISGNSAP
ncbi:hypothetical protein BGZ52_003900 [Haplosporangium bisporale]|nr:hypothetical protein BGZ52_003900 [Haplosporangium bisporale]